MRQTELLFVLMVLMCSGCGRTYNDQPPAPGDKEELLNVNRNVVRDEAKAIEEFNKARGYKMQRTGTGLNYDVYQKGNGNMADKSGVLHIAYKVFLLDGTLCYEIPEEKPERLILGRKQQTNGLEEGLLFMDEGAKARFVVPNHLAFGLTGDQDRVPPASALYYEVHLVKIERLENETE